MSLAQSQMGVDVLILAVIRPPVFNLSRFVKKIEARKMLEKAVESQSSASCFVRQSKCLQAIMGIIAAHF
jgi:hypothetical protein